MRYLELKEQLKDFLVFSLNDIRKIEPSFHRQRLNEWQDKGYIKKIVNEYYVFSDAEMSESALFAIANKIYEPSYVSLEMALSFYQLIPESVYGVTSVTSRKTYEFSTSMARFSYRKIKPELMFGYRLVSSGGRTSKIADPEKAILDYFYLNPKLKTSGDFEELRMNADNFREQADIEKINRYLSLYKSKALEKRTSQFIKYITHA